MLANQENRVSIASEHEDRLLVVYGLWLALSVLHASLLGIYVPYNIVSGACMAAFVVLELMEAKSRLHSPIGILIVCMVTTIGVMTRVFDIIYAAVIIYCLRGIDFKRIARLSAIVLAVAVAFVVSLALLGIVENYSSFDGRERMYLGFTYALVPAQFMLSITCLVICSLGEDVSWHEVCLLLLANTLFFVATDSRICYTLAIAALAGAMILKHWVGRLDSRSIWSGAFALCFVFCGMLGVGLTLAYDPVSSVMATLNNALGGRLSFGYAAYNNYGVPVLGQEIKFVGNGLQADGSVTTGNYNYVDCLYMQLLVHYGIVMSVLFIGLMTALCFKIRRRGEAYYLLVLVLMAIHCLIDDLSLFLYLNPLMILVSTLLVQSCVYGRGRLYDSSNESYSDVGKDNECSMARQFS